MSAPAACILDADGPRLTSREARFFSRAQPWGFILFARNVEAPAQLRALCDEMRGAVGRHAPILVDQEGGRVQRLGPPHWREWPSPRAHAATAGDRASAAIWMRYRLIAAELSELGIDVNCAPTADIAGLQTHTFLADRCFGADAGTVARVARAAAEGMMDGGVLPVVKHIPGHGRARADSHHALPVVGADMPALRETDFAPFRALRDLPMAMTAHVVYTALDPRPATTSPVVMEAIRRDIGFSGLVMSDDLSMQALKGCPEQRVRAALDAGCDVALYCNATLAEREAVAEAAGPLAGAALSRAEAALAMRRAPKPVDIAALEAKLEALTGDAWHG
ncbi:beta-N-acetylhexosaminidase [Roseovarius salinarum]|uniref:beta-N-acetylhexosaminidase n=1 Tax=Roseovarius salinarum TaxID=1981892 RepID=UPI0018E49F8F|nr:beta-N-acetylhexosaminidase [Roseovarius salinarum]